MRLALAIHHPATAATILRNLPMLATTHTHTHTHYSHALLHPAMAAMILRFTHARTTPRALLQAAAGTRQWPQRFCGIFARWSVGMQSGSKEIGDASAPKEYIRTSSHSTEK